ncbi:Ff.00g011990.m01.CDS01 [Fusarium sp. VM40]|nr:Ff.00g011990.m01.CDS01 [Fusarium sp. VM40]
MVNTGKPSMDCFPCRRRKLRCDLKPETCGQCRRARISCHGYRNTQDLIFRDETHAAKKKVVARQWYYGNQLAILPPPGPNLNLDVVTQCRETFFVLYVTGLSRSCASLLPLYNQVSMVSHLSYSVDAVSLAFSAIQFDSRELSGFATKKYLAAVKSLGLSLREPNAVINDEILQSILLLDLYEKLMGPSLNMSGSWMTHIQGAMSMIESRGLQNVSNHISTQLTRSAFSHLVISCGIAKFPIPDSQITVRKDLSRRVMDEKWDYMGILVDIVNLRAILPESKANLDSGIKERAFEINRKLEYLEESLAKTCGPVTIRANTACYAYCFDGQYDVYPAHYAMQICNALRSMRLEMEDLMRDKSRESRNDASKTINEIARQICRTVAPYIMPHGRPENAEPFTPMQKLKCKVLLAPLFQAAQLSTEACVQEWVWKSLEYMSERGNMRLAKEVLNLSKKRQSIDHWTIWAMAGCYAMAA